MSLKEITTACNGVYHGVDSLQVQTVSGVAIDSRKIQDGFLFVPIKGERVDGHDFIPQVMTAGALCTLSDHPIANATFPYILVESCEQALQDIAEHYRTALGIPVVGITGSVGKTSTKEMIASVLSTKYHVLKTEGNYNNEIGVPLTIFNLTDEHEIAVLEMGINHFGEMTRLSKIARPDYAVITNIGQCHLEYLNDRDGVLKAKTEIFEYMNPKGTVILNGEDDKLTRISAIDDEVPHFFGLSEECDVYATHIENLGLQGTRCTIHLTEDCSFTCIIPIPGEHMVLNALAGASVGLELGLTNEEIKRGIEALIPVSGRNNIISTDTYTLIDDCYNANPISMKASLDVLATATTRKVAILGDMGELGNNEIQMHSDVGQYSVQKNIDVICCIGTLCKHMQQAAEQAITEYNLLHEDSPLTSTIYHFPDLDSFLDQQNSFLQKGDSILIKASHFMEFERIVTTLKTI